MCTPFGYIYDVLAHLQLYSIHDSAFIWVVLSIWASKNGGSDIPGELEANAAFPKGNVYVNVHVRV